MSEILFFLADGSPSADEQSQINRLNQLAVPAFSKVGVRNALETSIYTPNLESADYVAGDIPSDYTSVTDYGYASEDRPLAMENLPADTTLEAAGTQQLQVLSVDGTSLLDLDIQDITDDTDVAYSTDDTAVATVDSAGEITGVGDGTCIITATYTYDGTNTETSTTDVLVSTP